MDLNYSMKVLSSGSEEWPVFLLRKIYESYFLTKHSVLLLSNLQMGSEEWPMCLCGSEEYPRQQDRSEE